MAEAADQPHRLVQYFRQAAAMAARLWIKLDSPSQRYGEAIVPIFIDRGAPTHLRLTPSTIARHRSNVR